MRTKRMTLIRTGKCLCAAVLVSCATSITAQSLGQVLGMAAGVWREAGDRFLTPRQALTDHNHRY